MIRVDVGRTSPRRRNFSGGSRSCRFADGLKLMVGDFRRRLNREEDGPAAKKAKN